MKKQVSVIMGSVSDHNSVIPCLDILDEFKIGYDVDVISAHRCPDKIHDYAKSAERRGIKIIICAAGGAAHLAGVVASMTPLPVIGVPMDTGRGGLDSLYSTVQMPAGVPVATVGIGKSGAKNAGLLAVQMLGVNDQEIVDDVIKYKRDQEAQINSINDQFKEKCGY